MRIVILGILFGFSVAMLENLNTQKPEQKLLLWKTNQCIQIVEKARDEITLSQQRIKLNDITKQEFAPMSEKFAFAFFVWCIFSFAEVMYQIQFLPPLYF